MQRADHWAKKRYPKLSRQQAHQAIERGLILATNGAPVKKGDRLELTDLDFSSLDKHLESLRKGFETEIEILHEEKDFAVIDKPAGIPSHPVHLWDNKTITHWAFSKFPQVASLFSDPQPTITPHRLDTYTSGILIVAKTPKGFSEWRTTFTSKELKKTYLAWCWGVAPHQQFRIEYPIGHCPGDRRKMRCQISEYGKVLPPVLEAMSEVSVLSQLPDRFLCEVSSTTGVTHQVRVHLASIGFPLIGDALYDSKGSRRDFEGQHHLLRAVSLSTNRFTFEASREKFMKIFTNKAH